MSRIANAWRALMGAGPAAASSSCQDCGEIGPLFGLSPPDGCYFDVFCRRGEAWFVDIWRSGDGRLAQGLALIGGCYSLSKTDEELIIIAANNALAEFAAKEARAHLVGQYPPKRAKGAK